MRASRSQVRRGDRYAIRFKSPRRPWQEEFRPALRTSDALRHGLQLEVPRKRTSVVEHTPRNARELVGRRGSQDVVMEALGCSSQPFFKAELRPTPRLRQYGARANDEQRAHIFVAALAKPTEHRSVACGELLRHQAEPGCKVTTFREGCTISDRGHHGARCQRTDSRNAHQPLAAVVLARQCLDFAGHRINSIVQPAPVLGQFLERRTMRRESTSVR